MRINQVSLNQGIEWYKRAWHLFYRDIGSWLLIAAFLLILSLGLGFLPFFNLLLLVLMPLLMACAMFLARKAYQGDSPSLEKIFVVVGHSAKRTQLLWMGVILLAFFAIVMLILPEPGNKPVFNYSLSQLAELHNPIVQAETPGWDFKTLWFNFCMALLMVSLMILLMFAPALVLFRKISVTDALKASVKGCWENKGVISLFILSCMILGLLAILPFGLGLLVLLPVKFNALYLAYQAIFVQHHSPAITHKQEVIQ